MKALVAGATGETGRRIVRVLVAKGIPVKVLVRDRQTAQAMLPNTVELVEGDVLKRDTIEAAIGDCTVLLCATGARPGFDPTGPYQVDYEGTKNLVDVAKAHSIEQFVLVSSLCVSRFFSSAQFVLAGAVLEKASRKLPDAKWCALHHCSSGGLEK